MTLIDIPNEFPDATVGPGTTGSQCIHQVCQMPFQVSQQALRITLLIHRWYSWSMLWVYMALPYNRSGACQHICKLFKVPSPSWLLVISATSMHNPVKWRGGENESNQLCYVRAALANIQRWRQSILMAKTELGIICVNLNDPLSLFQIELLIKIATSLKSTQVSRQGTDRESPFVSGCLHDSPKSDSLRWPVVSLMKVNFTLLMTK